MFRSNNNIPIDITEYAETMNALGHPTRMFIIKKLISEDEYTVGQLTTLIGDDTSTVSKHLKKLKAAGLVESTEGERKTTRIYIIPQSIIQKVTDIYNALSLLHDDL